MPTESAAPEVPRDALAAAVASALGCRVRSVTQASEPEDLGGQAHEGTLGVLRLRGTARTDDGERAYDIVAKCARDGGNPRIARQIRREAAVYRETSLAALPESVRPARCFGVHVEADAGAGDGGATWIFLEHHGTLAPPWTSEPFETAAAAIGRFHAATRDIALPAVLRAGRSAFRTFTTVPVITDVVARLAADLPAGLDSPGVRDVLRIWERRADLFDALDRGPTTLAHGDFHNGNVFLVDDGCVAIDWAYAGPGGLGEDAGTLSGADYCFRRVSIPEFLAMLPATWSAYRDGLRAGGWDHDERHARFGFTALAAFDAGARLLVEVGMRRDEPGNGARVTDTVARLDAIRPLLAESSALASELHGVGLL